MADETGAHWVYLGVAAAVSSILARFWGWRHSEVVDPQGVDLLRIVTLVGRELAVSNLQRRQLFCSTRTLSPRRVRVNLAVSMRRVRVMIMLRRGRSCRCLECNYVLLLLHFVFALPVWL
ncbi:hypothetical protein, partial [Ralstonia sp.]|uniref:hypothetical protein n=1 Tax=Ralstonia sp. TaxID=54061 RepID=UPI00257B2655